MPRRTTWLPLLATALLGGCSGGVLDAAGPVAGGERVILGNAVLVMAAIIVPTILATLGFAWWFRQSNTRADYKPDFAYSGRIELVVWSVPVMVILLLGGLAWIGSHDLDPYKPLASRQRPLEVQVVSLDWKWLFLYPGQNIASINHLVVPAGRPVHFTLTSGSVMTAFWIPRLGSMIYVMNGMTTQLNLQADRPGAFHSLASHISGDGFSDMHFVTDAVPAAAFDSWVAAARAGGATLDQPRYRALMRQSVFKRPVTFAGVDPALFHDIVAQVLPPAPGPQAGNGGPQVSPRSGINDAG